MIAHTCRGPQDPRREATGKRLEALGYKGLAAKLKGGRILAETTGSILQAVLERADVQRVAVAGGDTSSYIASQLDIRAVEMVGSRRSRGAFVPGLFGRRYIGGDGDRLQGRTDGRAGLLRERPSRNYKDIVGGGR